MVNSDSGACRFQRSRFHDGRQSLGGFHQWEIPKMLGLQWKIRPQKRMRTGGTDLENLHTVLSWRNWAESLPFNSPPLPAVNQAPWARRAGVWVLATLQETSSAAIPQVLAASERDSQFMDNSSNSNNMEHPVCWIRRSKQALYNLDPIGF